MMIKKMKTKTVKIKNNNDPKQAINISIWFATYTVAI